jgi:SAM-dependent methyltransferase
MGATTCRINARDTPFAKTECRNHKKMANIIKQIRNGLLLLGIDPRKGISTLRGLPSYLIDLHTMRRQSLSSPKAFPFGRLFPCLDDRNSQSGMMDSQYFYQDLWVAGRIFNDHPKSHYDVGSRIDGFIAHVAAFRNITAVDIRPQPKNIRNITFLQADLMQDVQGDLLDCCDSLSCLHVLEHFGLGRYGDPIRYDGHLLGLENLNRMLRPGGRFYLSVPIGPQRIEFNAHRVFSMAYLLGLLNVRYSIELFSYVDDKGRFHENAGLNPSDIQNNYGCHFGCGILEMVKN